MADQRRSTGSLFERAVDIYDFGAAIRGHVAPPIDPALVPEAPAVEEPAAGDVRAALDWNGPVCQLDRPRLAEAGFLLPDGPVSELSEQFRLVKRQLLTGERAGDAARRILVCSANAGEGKTFCAVNLALSLAAEKDLDVLLIDADMVKPGVVATLGIEDGPGLMDALADASLRVEDCVVRTDIPSLAVLPAGRATNADTEYLASAHMERLLDRLTAERPNLVVLFDSPPLLAASPAGVLAGLADQALLVVRADATSESALRDAVAMLSGCGDIRLLLNAATVGTGTRFGSYYGKAA